MMVTGTETVCVRASFTFVSRSFDVRACHHLGPAGGIVTDSDTISGWSIVG